MARYISNYSGDFSSFGMDKLSNSIQISNHTNQIKTFPAYAGTDKYISGYFSTLSPYLDYDFGNYTFSGKVTRTEATFTKLLFVFNYYINKIVFEGNLNVDLKTGKTTGYYDHAAILMPSGERFDIYGNAKYGSSVFNINSLTYQSADNETLILKGEIKLPGSDEDLTGKISSFIYRDSEGHKYTVSGLNTNIAKLYAHSSLIDAVEVLMSGDDKASGTQLADVMNGFGGADTLNGAAGIDTLIGGSGDDTYLIDLNAIDVVTEDAEAGNDTYQIISNNTSKTTPITLSIADYPNIENLTVSGKGLFDLVGDNNANKLIGNASANSITGGDGDDTLIGGGGADSLYGGVGNDTYVLDAVGYSYAEFSGEGSSDTIEIAYKNAGKKAVGLLLSDYTNFENLSVSGAGLYNLTGDANDNILKGSASANVIDGNGGEDTMDGGGGNDTYYVDSVGDVTGELLAGKAGGVDVVNASESHILGANIDKLILTGSENISGTGNASNNLILGNSGDNVLDGGAGADTLQGGEGNDIYYVDNEKDQVIDVDVGTTVFSTSLNYTLGKDFTSITLIGFGNINASGNDKDNLITGNIGNNILNGGKGLDTLIGGLGDDTYILDMSAMDEVHEELEGGNDTYQFTNNNLSKSTPITLNVADYLNIESLAVVGKGLFNLVGDSNHNKLTGNASANSLSGGAGNDTLIGGAGNDTMDGGTGDDYYVVDSLGDVFTEAVDAGDDTLDIVYANTRKQALMIDLSDYHNFENLTVSGKGLFNLTGTGEDNLLVGNSSANYILAGAGNDTLVGAGGNDTLLGGLGDDVYYLQNNAATVIEFVDSGNDTLWFAYDNTEEAAINLTVIYSNVEKYGLAGTGKFNLTGNEQNNYLIGNASDNILDGGFGSDTLEGGAGNDIYFVDESTDLISDSAGQDIVYSSASTYTLGSGVESIVLTGSGSINVTGNELNNSILGNAGDNVLDGGLGVNTLNGGLGNDTYVVHSTEDFLIDASGNDIVQSYVDYVLVEGVESLYLLGHDNLSATGNSANNYLAGNDGNNTLDGMGGDDTLVGGMGNDTYVMYSSDDSSVFTRLIEAVDGGVDTVAVNYDNPNVFGLFVSLPNNVENITILGTGEFILLGNEADNQLTAGIDSHTLFGFGGNDSLIGNSADDGLNGGAGNDTLFGGDGNDIYMFDSVFNQDYNVDRLIDFKSGEDKIYIAADSLGLDINQGSLDINDFVSGAGATAQDFTDRVIYDTSDGSLYYDSDGSGGVGMVRFAILSSAPTLVFSDIFIT